ncbi:MAG: ABC transporter ATP-binding protein [Parvularculaceae bacterium]|nr:ABC transporter ATP-binding protein [Parvularculaceae bacterium]
MLELIEVSRYFRQGLLATGKVVDKVSLRLKPGEMVGLIGESGCGKSTLGRLAVKLVPVSGGRILLDGVEVTSMSERRFRAYRRTIQIVFQHPETALDPAFTLRRSMCEALAKSGLPRHKEASWLEQVAEEVNVPPSILDRYPDQVSGGEIQRVAVARVLLLRPRYIVLDEPTSMLDVSSQAQIMQALMRQVRRYAAAMLLISHDLELVKAVCSRVMVMRYGRIIERGTTESVFGNPQHEYSRELIGSVCSGLQTAGEVRQ